MASNETDETVEYDADAVGKVKSSRPRLIVIEQLYDHPKTPTEVSDESDKGLSHISRALTETSDMGIVECLNPDSKKGRLYRLTGEGEKVANKLDEWGQI